MTAGSVLVGGRTNGSRQGILAILAALCTVLGLIGSPRPADASAARPLIVTLTFDDGVADQLAAAQLLHRYGMVGTFYINSAFIGMPGYMTRADLVTLSADGHEIGGHTVSHQSLVSLQPEEADRQICQDRDTLLSWGHTVNSLAYPYADFDATVQRIARHCGYNTARAVGDLWSPHSCSDCPSAETLPPADPYAVRTPDDVQADWTLADLQTTVLQAEAQGGWLPFNLHHVCDGCAVESIRPALLEAFLAWLQNRSTPDIATTVRTVQQAVGGDAQPAVAPAPPVAPGEPEMNTVRNASLEQANPVDPQVPDCWSPSGFGRNVATQTRVGDAHSGSWAAQITMTSRDDGDAKLLPTMDLGQCSSQVAAGRTYEVSAWYRSTVDVYFTLYRRDAVGSWSYWTQSPRLAPASEWTRARWVTPTPPEDVVAVSFGLTIDTVGVLTTDDYGFVDTPVDDSTPGPAGAASGTTGRARQAVELRTGPALPPHPPVSHRVHEPPPLGRCGLRPGRCP